MIDYLNPWLDRWARWSVSQKERMGHASASPVDRMMRENATTSKSKHRRRRYWLQIGEGENTRLVQRDIDPMRCKETPLVKKAVYTEPACQMMDEAYCNLREDSYREAIRFKYVTGLPDDASADQMHMSRAAFKSQINIAHESLDTYMRAVFPDIYDQIVTEMRDYLRSK